MRLACWFRRSRRNNLSLDPNTKKKSAIARRNRQHARRVRYPEISLESRDTRTMARLHEYQGKAILAANGFKIPRGRAASTADDAVIATKELSSKKDSEVVTKIQAWTTGRAGIGGVMFAKRPDDVRGHAARMLEMKVGQFPIEAVFGGREDRHRAGVFSFLAPSMTPLGRRSLSSRRAAAAESKSAPPRQSGSIPLSTAMTDRRREA